MFGLYTNTPQFFNDICDEIRLFENIRRIEKTEQDDTQHQKVLRHFLLCSETAWCSCCEYFEYGERKVSTQKEMQPPQTDDALIIKKLQKRLVKQSIYETMQQGMPKTLPWGSLTGIRPTKLFRELSQEGGTGYAEKMFLEEYDVSPSKVELAQRIVQNQEKHIEGIRSNDIDIYIGIPFCSSRCKYCSFISRDLSRAAQMKCAYLDALERELQMAKGMLERYHVRAVYIGGGTPTALTAEELDRLLDTVYHVFGQPIEYTVEAGRPDTVTREKLAVLQKHNVTRISINPQTLKQHTLELIGRNHTVQQFFDAYGLARSMGFDNINTDIIIGLPEESMGDARKTLEGICALTPENITVHTLAIKNSSEFALEQKGTMQNMHLVRDMVEFAEQELMRKGYEPYYLYRQKYMSGNLENTGFTRQGKICNYNIDHMEELTSILAFGAGSISKRLYGTEQRIERAANVKDVEHYISRIDEMAGRKKALF